MQSEIYIYSFSLKPYQSDSNENNLPRSSRQRQRSHSQLLLGLVEHCKNFGNSTIAIRILSKNKNGEFSIEFKLLVGLESLDDFQRGEFESGITTLLRVSEVSKLFSITIENKSDCFEQKEFSYLGEILKSEEVVNGAYAFNLLGVNIRDDMEEVVNLISRLRENFIFEIVLRPLSQNAYKSDTWDAVNLLVSQLKKAKHHESNDIASRIIPLYERYQKSREEQTLFQYSIRGFGQTRASVSCILGSLLSIDDSSWEERNFTGSPGKLLILSKQKEPEKFEKAYKTSLALEATSYLEWGKWKTKFADKPLISLNQNSRKTGLGDGSTSTSSLYLRRSMSARRLLTTKQQNADTSLDIFKNDFMSPLTLQMRTLKPLSNIATLKEVSGFFKIPIIRNSEVEGLEYFEQKLEVFTANSIYKKHERYIDLNTYIVGLNDQGVPILSDWSQIPHRLIAGVSGSGKTNFLNWLIFQFLYVNPNRKIYITDLKGLDYLYLKKISPNIQIVTSVDECAHLVDVIHEKEYRYRIQLMQDYEVSDLGELQEEGVEIDRTLWIIDEAADIANANYKLREKVENSLSEYARKGRSLGLHVAYCTQRPTTEVISKQVTDQCEEKMLFRVSADASQRILDNTLASTISPSSKGRGVLQGINGTSFVNTPFIKIPRGRKISIQNTLWNLVLNQT